MTVSLLLMFVWVDEPWVGILCFWKRNFSRVHIGIELGALFHRAGHIRKGWDIINSNLKSKWNTMPVLIPYISRSTLKFLVSFGIYPIGMLLNGGAYFTFCLSIQTILCNVYFITVLILCFLLCVSAVWCWWDHCSAKL